MNAKDDKRIQSINSMETNAYGMRKNLVSKREENMFLIIHTEYKQLEPLGLEKKTLYLIW